jgi:hypothetical protein
MFILQNVHQTFKSKTSVNVPGREWLKASVRFAVELNEDIVPYFYDLGLMVQIHEIRCVPASNTVEKDFARETEFRPRRSVLWTRT